MAVLRQYLLMASVVCASSWARHLHLRAQDESLQLEPSTFPNCSDVYSLPFRDQLRHAHFFCTGVERIWNGTLCNCAVAHIRAASVMFLEKAAAEVPNASLEVNPAVALVRPEDAGGTRVYLPQCRRDDRHRMPALFYRSIRQSRSDDILATIQALAGMNPDIVEEGFWNRADLCGKLDDKRAAARGKDDGPILFTLVRDPLEHFMEVYASASSAGAFQVRGDRSGDRMFSPSHFIHFLAHILNGGEIAGSPILQSQMLQSSACTSRFDFIGKLEFAASDWMALASRLGCERNIFDNAAYPDLMSGNYTVSMPPDDYAHLMKFINNDGGALLRVLCWLLLPDYAVFDYHIPSACQDGDFDLIF